DRVAAQRSLAARVPPLPTDEKNPAPPRRVVLAAHRASDDLRVAGVRTPGPRGRSHAQGRRVPVPCPVPPLVLRIARASTAARTASLPRPLRRPRGEQQGRLR